MLECPRGERVNLSGSLPRPGGLTTAMPAHRLDKIKFATDAPTWGRALALYESGKITNFRRGSIDAGRREPAAAVDGSATRDRGRYQRLPAFRGEQGGAQRDCLRRESRDCNAYEGRASIVTK